MNKLAFFFNNNKILFLSWLFLFLGGGSIGYETFKAFLPSYLMYIIYWYYLLEIVVIFAIFYSFYQSIKSININKKYAFVLLILYLVFWIFFPYNLIEHCSRYGIDRKDIGKLFIFILINICIYLCHKFNRQSRTMIPCLLFYSINFFLILFCLLWTGSSDNCYYNENISL